MQFELEALAEKRHLFFAVTRPRVRFDIAGAIQWGFFSLKLTLPLLMGRGRDQGEHRHRAEGARSPPRCEKSPP